MKWYHFWVKGRNVDFEEYLEMPDEVSASEVLIKNEFKYWLAIRALSSDLGGAKKGYESARRPPVPWLIDKAASLKEEARIMVEKANRYKELAEDKGGRRAPSQVDWLAGTLFSEEKRTEPADRRKVKK